MSPFWFRLKMSKWFFALNFISVGCSSLEPNIMIMRFCLNLIRIKDFQDSIAVSVLIFFLTLKFCTQQLVKIFVQDTMYYLFAREKFLIT